jgi:hypothetical protein
MIDTLRFPYACHANDALNHNQQISSDTARGDNLAD